MQPTPSLVTLAIRVVQHAPCALCTLAPELKQDLSVLEAACARDPSMVKEVPTELLCDVLEAVPAVKLPLVYKHAMQCDRLKALCSSKQTTHLVLRRNALCFRSVSKAWKDDAELAHATVTSEDSTLRYVSARLRHGAPPRVAGDDARAAGLGGDAARAQRRAGAHIPATGGPYGDADERRRG